MILLLACPGVTRAQLSRRARSRVGTRVERYRNGGNAALEIEFFSPPCAPRRSRWGEVYHAACRVA